MELVTGEGDRLNLKSKLCQYVSMANIFSNGYIKELDLVAHDKEDIEFAIIELRDVKWCENLDEKFQYHTITYYRKSTPVGNYPYFLPKEDCL